MNSPIAALKNCDHVRVTYNCIENEIWCEDYGNVCTYGIELRISCANNSMNTAQYFLLYPDVSIDRDLVHYLAECMNDLQLAPIHVEDVIEDYLVDYSVE